MTIISTMSRMSRPGYIKGNCASCHKDVYESLAMLDDAYNVWMGKCPDCGALNYLAMTGLRGYSSGGMSLVLPTDEEVAANGLSADTPTQGSKGPATLHGTNAGELMHKLANGESIT